jgi:hypothetical protein
VQIVTVPSRRSGAGSSHSVSAPEIERERASRPTLVLLPLVSVVVRQNRQRLTLVYLDKNSNPTWTRIVPAEWAEAKCKQKAFAADSQAQQSSSGTHSRDWTGRPVRQRWLHRVAADEEALKRGYWLPGPFPRAANLSGPGLIPAPWSSGLSAAEGLKLGSAWIPFRSLPKAQTHLTSVAGRAAAC